MEKVIRKPGNEDIEALYERGQQADEAGRMEILKDLISLYDESEDPERLRSIGRTFLRTLRPTPSALGDERIVAFLADAIQPGDFAALNWESTRDVIDYSERLYSFHYQNQKVAEQIQKHMQNLLSYALHQFEANGEYEKMFELLRTTPTWPEMGDLELRRLRSRVYLYEMQRINRIRRRLFGYLGIYVFLITVVFPFLFVNAENGWIQNKIEEATKVEIQDEGWQRLTYMDGLYWSVITSMSIGYGDITPHTITGRIIAMVLGVMGVITVGVIAGLLLERLTPRQLE